MYEDWEKKHEELKVKIKDLKQRRDDAKSDNEHDSINYELQELLIQSHVIYQFLADLGTFVYIQENRV